MKQLFTIIAVVGIVIGVYIIISSCAYLEAAPPADTYYNEFTDFSQFPDEGLLLLRCSWAFRIEELTIKSSDFCVLGEKIVTRDGPKIGWPYQDIGPKWQVFTVEGVIKVHSVIYGDPETNQIPFDYDYGSRLAPKQSPFWMSSPPCAIVTAYNEPDKPGSRIIVFGKGKGENCNLSKAVWESTTVISPQAIKVMKEFECLPQAEFEKRTAALLLNSNNQELLSYIFRKDPLDTPRKVKIIEVISDKEPKTPERRFLTYGWALYLLYEFTDINQPLIEHNHLAIDALKINDNQRQVLIDIATKQFAEITSSKEGIKYLRLIGMFTYDVSGRLERSPGPWKEEWRKFTESNSPIASKLFDKAPTLKDNLKKITDSLSERFKNDKDYPEWDKWVNKIFPAESPNQK